MGGSGSAPAPPDYKAAARAGVIADAETLPFRRYVDAAARLGRSGTYQLDGKDYSFDFTGVGDADLAAFQRRIDKENALGTAETLATLQDRFGVRLAQQSREQLKAADPIGFALREQMGTLLTNDLAAGSRLTGDQRRQVQQRVRGSQTARGNTFGSAPAIDEVLALTGFGENLKQQRVANASAFLNGPTPQSQFGSLPNVPFVPSSTRGLTLDPNAGANSTQFASNAYSAYTSAYSAAQSAKSSPWLQGLGIVGGIAVNALTAGAFGQIQSALGGGATWSGFGNGGGVGIPGGGFSVGSF